MITGIHPPWRVEKHWLNTSIIRIVNARNEVVTELPKDEIRVAQEIIKRVEAWPCKVISYDCLTLRW